MVIIDLFIYTQQISHDPILTIIQCPIVKSPLECMNFRRTKENEEHVVLFLNKMTCRSPSKEKEKIEHIRMSVLK